MSTKMGFWRWALASAAVVVASGTASARLINDPPSVTTNETAAIVIFPKIRVDTDLCQRDSLCSVSGNACVFTAGNLPANDSACPNAGTDTVVQLTNTSEFLSKVTCFYVNANGHCSNDTNTICTPENFREVCPAGVLRCEEGWQETDFHLTLTKRQPISWSVSRGLSSLPLNDTPGQGNPPQFNDGSIPPAPENSFLGELRCIQVDVSTELPTDRNDLKGEASVVTTVDDQIDVAKHNAIGIQAIEGAQTDDLDRGTLNIGGPNAEYRGCPNILTMDHFFDNANVTTHNNTIEGRVNSTLTLIPCGADFLNQVPEGPLTVQYLIYNEFEQRFSTSNKVTCYLEVPLADIDTRAGAEGNNFSIFAAGVQGTLTGMTRIRSVSGTNNDGYDARGIVALLEEHWASGVCASPGIGAGGPPAALTTLCTTDADCSGGDECVEPHVSTTAANIQIQGTREQGDRIVIPIP